jgi:hypothetical protein
MRSGEKLIMSFKPWMGEGGGVSFWKIGRIGVGTESY